MLDQYHNDMQIQMVMWKGLILITWCLAVDIDMEEILITWCLAVDIDMEEILITCCLAVDIDMEEILITCCLAVDIDIEEILITWCLAVDIDTLNSPSSLPVSEIVTRLSSNIRYLKSCSSGKYFTSIISTDHYSKKNLL